MKNILLLFILFTGLVSWGQSPEIITYPNGDKHFVVWYSGTGVNKTVTKRETYQEQNQGGKLQKVENYKNGEPHGVFQYYNSEGILTKEENFVNGKLHGRKKTWNKKGQILTDQIYENGNIKEAIKWCEYYKNGQLKFSVGSGQSRKEYYENGQLKRDGDKEYYESGQLKRDGDNYFKEDIPVKDYIDKTHDFDLNSAFCIELEKNEEGKYIYQNRYENYKSIYSKYLSNAGYDQTAIDDGIEYIFNVKIPNYCKR